MGKQISLDGTEGDAVASQDGREGAGGRNPEAPAKARNSSGSRSPAAQVVDLHLKVRILTRAVQSIAASLGDEQLVSDLKAVLNGKA